MDNCTFDQVSRAIPVCWVSTSSAQSRLTVPSTGTLGFIKESTVARLDAKWPEPKIGAVDEDQVDERVRFIAAVGHGCEVDPVEARIAVASTRRWRPAGRPVCTRPDPQQVDDGFVV